MPGSIVMPGNNDGGVRRLALLVATDKYDDPGLKRLQAPSGDVRGLADVLQDEAIGGFTVETVVNQPSYDVMRAIEELFADARLRDVLLLYFSGHGVLSPDGRLYFAMKNTSLRHLLASAVPDTSIQHVMLTTRSRSKILVLDCCHSGAFGKGLVPKSAPGVHPERRLQGSGSVILTASTELQYAFEESELQHAFKNEHEDRQNVAASSLFTRYIVQGLNTGEADLNEDGQIAIDELYDYVNACMSAWAPHQTPGWSGGGHGDIFIAKSIRGGVVSALPPDLQAALRSDMPELRTTAVEVLGRKLFEDGVAEPGVKRELRRIWLGDPSQQVVEAARVALARCSVRRQQDYWEFEVPIKISEALPGTDVDVPTINRYITQRIRVPPGTPHGAVQRIRREGPLKADGSGIGDLHYRFVIDVPTPDELPGDQRRVIEELSKVMGQREAESDADD